MSSTLALTPAEYQTVEAIFARLFPASASTPGTREIGAAAYLDRALSGWCRDQLPHYRSGLAGIDSEAFRRFGHPFHLAGPEHQDRLISELEAGKLPGKIPIGQPAFFQTLRQHCLEGLFADPLYGGNHNALGWVTIGHPGVWLQNSAEENLSPEPVAKNGCVQSLADVLPDLAHSTGESHLRGEEFDALTAGEIDDVDVLIVGMGGVGSFVAPMLVAAGLRVVGLEAGPLWRRSDFIPDELGAAYYCRAGLGEKFSQEQPRWRTSTASDSHCATYSLGRMMNGVGGSVIHYGAWLRRFHPHHLRFRSHIVERWGDQVIPEDCSVIDWPVTYDELEPYFSAAEQLAGVAGDESNPFIRRSWPLSLPPMRPFRMGVDFTAATRQLGLHPHPCPVGQATNLPVTEYDAVYCAWNNGFGSWAGNKWHPGLNIPDLASTSDTFWLRTRARVIRVLTDYQGHVAGVEYLDRAGVQHTQRARVVVLAAYTFENVRLMFLSGSDRHPAGLGNSAGQLGRHYMTKQFAHVDGHFPDRVFNRHTGPASQAVVLDDFLAESFDSMAEGAFLGGATLGAENQFLPLQIARESLPADVPQWGAGYRDHLLKWQHFGVVRIQPDALPYEHHTIDIDPVYRDKSGIGMPVVRLTYDLMPNEQRQAAYFERKGEEILREMGATKTWAGPWFTGVCSSHDLGGARMADDPSAGVVDRTLQVHDTPGLYVFSGATFPTCPGINPTLTLWALTTWASEQLIQRLQRA